MFEAYNKSLPLSSLCVCLCVAETAHVRQLKVTLMLVLGRHWVGNFILILTN